MVFFPRPLAIGRASQVPEPEVIGLQNDHAPGRGPWETRRRRAFDGIERRWLMLGKFPGLITNFIALPGRIGW
jgi:hypothetical protein